MKSMIFVMRFVVTALALFASLSSMAEIEKEYHFEEDGFEWYEITTDISDGCLQGAQDANGNIIVPAKYNVVSYDRGNKNMGGYFSVFKWEAYADGSRKKDSNGLEITYEGVYTKDGKYIIPTDKQFRRISKWTTDVNGIEKEFFQFIRGDKFNEYGICDANGKVLFMNKVDKSVKMLHFWGADYSISLYTPEYGKGSYQCEDAGDYYFDFEHNLIGTEKDSPAEMIRIAKQKNLRHPLADAPAKATPNTSSAASSQRSAKPSQNEQSSASSSVDMYTQWKDLVGYHWRTKDGSISVYFDWKDDNSDDLIYEITVNSEMGRKTLSGTWVPPLTPGGDYLITFSDDTALMGGLLTITSFSNNIIVIEGKTLYRVE